jgi:hypothetical protein
MLELLFLVDFPLLLGGLSAWLTWRALSRPWLYFVVSTVTLYLLYGGLFYLLAPRTVGYTVHVARPGEPSTSEQLFPFLQPYAEPLLLFAVLAIGAIVLLLKAFKRKSGHREA